MLRKCLLLGLLLALLIPVADRPHTQAQTAESDAPFLYYYSPIHNAFVIERADGTDRRILAEHHLPETGTSIHGPGWSPSGLWFAWDDLNYPRYTDSSTLYVVGADGGEVMTWTINERGSIRGLQWSPTADMLLVRFELASQEYYLAFAYYLLDPTTGNMNLFYVTRDIHPQQAYWTPDGQSIAIYYTQDIATNLWDQYPPGLTIMALDGSTTSRDVMFLWNVIPRLEQHPIG